MSYKHVFAVFVVWALAGCHGLINEYYLQGCAGYDRSLRQLQARPDGSKYLAKNPRPRVITVASNGSIYVYPEDRHGYQEFTARGNSFASGDLVGYGVPDIVYQGWKEHDRLKKSEEAEKEQMRLRDVKFAIKHPRKITMEELLGVKPDENMKPRLTNKIPRLFADVESYDFNTHNGMTQEQLTNLYMGMMRSGYFPPSEKVNGVKIVNGFRFHEIKIKHTTGTFYSYCLADRSLPLGEKYEAALTAVLDDIRAFMHTDVMPKYSESEATDHTMSRYWKWDAFETLDHQFFDISLSAHPNVSSWLLLLHVRKTIDPVVAAERRKESMDIWSMSIKDTIDKIKKDNEEAQRFEGPSRDLYNRVKQYLAVVRSDKGVGSGFLAKGKDGVHFYTNEHVVRGANKPNVQDINGSEIVLGDFEIVKGLDLVRFSVKDRADALSLNHSEVDLDMPVTVFGNSDGAGVLTALNGKILGVGPTMLEVSAEFVQGNSGSPILTMNGEVLGIATFAVNATEKENWVKKATRFNGVRRFGLRLDNVKWTKMDWDLYSTIVDR